jgi:hypothetical protein
MNLVASTINQKWDAWNQKKYLGESIGGKNLKCLKVDNLKKLRSVLRTRSLAEPFILGERCKLLKFSLIKNGRR